MIEGLAIIVGSAALIVYGYTIATDDTINLPNWSRCTAAAIMILSGVIQGVI